MGSSEDKDRSVKWPSSCAAPQGLGDNRNGGERGSDLREMVGTVLSSGPGRPQGRLTSGKGARNRSRAAVSALSPAAHPAPSQCAPRLSGSRGSPSWSSSGTG